MFKFRLITSIVLVLLFTLTLTVPVFAQDGDTDEPVSVVLEQPDAASILAETGEAVAEISLRDLIIIVAVTLLFIVKDIIIAGFDAIKARNPRKLDRTLTEAIETKQANEQYVTALENTFKQYSEDTRKIVESYNNNLGIFARMTPWKFDDAAHGFMSEVTDGVPLSDKLAQAEADKRKQSAPAAPLTGSELLPGVALEGVNLD